MPGKISLDKSNRRRGAERRYRRAQSDILTAAQVAEKGRVEARAQAAVERAAKAEVRLQLARGKAAAPAPPVIGSKRFTRIIE